MKHILPFCILLLAGLMSCSETTPTNESVSLTGTMRGRVLLSDTTYHLEDNHANTKVSIDGTSYTTMTDDNGYFSLQGVKTGTYTIRYSKAGYGDGCDRGFQFVGGGTVYLDTRYLGPKLSTYHTLISITDTVIANKHYIRLEVNDTNGARYFNLACFGRDSNIHADDSYNYVLQKDYLQLTSFYPDEGIGIKMNIEPNEFYTTGEKKGDTLYVALYEYCYYEYNEYTLFPASITYDSLYLKPHYNAVGPRSNTLMYIVP